MLHGRAARECFLFAPLGVGSHGAHRASRSQRRCPTASTCSVVTSDGINTRWSVCGGMGAHRPSFPPQPPPPLFATGNSPAVPPLALVAHTRTALSSAAAGNHNHATPRPQSRPMRPTHQATAEQSDLRCRLLQPGFRPPRHRLLPALPARTVSPPAPGRVLAPCRKGRTRAPVSSSSSSDNGSTAAAPQQHGGNGGTNSSVIMVIDEITHLAGRAAAACSPPLARLSFC